MRVRNLVNTILKKYKKRTFSRKFSLYPFPIINVLQFMCLLKNL